MPPDNESLQLLRFGEFVVDTNLRTLSRNGRIIPVTSKVLETLLAFLEKPGVTLTKQELMTRIWGDKIVEESNLVQNIAVLRRVLGDRPAERRFIATVPGCGYRFIAEVRGMASPGRRSTEIGPVERARPDRSFRVTKALVLWIALSILGLSIIFLAIGYGHASPLLNGDASFISEQVAAYLAPLLLIGSVALAARMTGMISSPVLRWRLMPILLAILPIEYALRWGLVGWTALGVLLVFIGVSEVLHAASPGRVSRILFCGFYDVDGNGSGLARTMLTRSLDREFVEAFDRSFRNHGVQHYHSISVVTLIPPAIMRRWSSEHTFHKLMDLYSSQGLGVVWGTVSQNGIRSLETKLNKRRYTGAAKAEDQFNRFVRVLNKAELSPIQRAGHAATVLSAIWSQSFCNEIAYAGDWVGAQRLAAESRGMIEAALRGVATTPRQQRALTLLSGCYCQTTLAVADAGEEGFA